MDTATPSTQRASIPALSLTSRINAASTASEPAVRSPTSPALPSALVAQTATTRAPRSSGGSTADIAIDANK